MTDQEYIESVLARITKGNPGAPFGLIATTLAQQKNTVLQRLAENIAKSENAATQSLLQKTRTTLVLVGGEVAVPTDSLTSALPNAKIILSDGTAPNTWPEPAEWAGTIYDLLNPPPIYDYIYFIAHAGLLKFRQYTANGVVTPTMNGASLNRADMVDNYIPLLSAIGLTDDIADVLFDTGVAMFNEAPIVTETEAAQG